MQSKLITLAGVILVTGGLLIATLVAGWGPLLGLDLQGGISVVLEPTEDVDSDTLDQAISIIRNRVDGIGVAEPEITRQGDRVVVALPGTDDQERALNLVGTTAEVRFRPVCGYATDSELIEGFLEDAEEEGDDSADEAEADAEETDADAEETDADAEETEPDEPAAEDDEETGLGLGGEGEFAYGYQDDVTEDVTELDIADLQAQLEEGFDGAEVDGLGGLTEEQLAEFQAQAGLAGGCVGAPTPGELGGLPITLPEDDEFDEFVVLPVADPDPTQFGSLLILGPARANGEVIRSAESDIGADITSGQYEVGIRTGGDQAGDLDELAAECNAAGPDCPTRQMAVTLDGAVVTAPNVNISDFSAGVVISGNFDKEGADGLALILRYGSLPVELEAINQQTVSATIGEDALRAGLIAGAVGLGLVALYMLFMYRVLGAIAIASLVISSALLWIIVAFLGEQQGLALTLAGITGIIVSFGVSLDSNVVVFENLKESVRNGKSVRSTVDRSFANAYSTIVKADFASLIGAVLLYFLTIGSVRGFALFLGIATILDLVVTYLFLRPAISWLGQSKIAAENPVAFGVPEPGSGDLGVAS